jgi:hypothetical protein
MNIARTDVVLAKSSLCIFHAGKEGNKRYIQISDKNYGMEGVEFKSM